MRIDFVRRAVDDVNSAAVRLPARDTAGKTLIRIGHAAVMLFLKLVFFGVRTGVAAQPEILDKLLAFLVGLELAEGLTLFVADDPDDVFVDPLLIGGLKLLAKPFFVLFLFSLRHGTRNGLARDGSLLGSSWSRSIAVVILSPRTLLILDHEERAGKT